MQGLTIRCRGLLEGAYRRATGATGAGAELTVDELITILTAVRAEHVSSEGAAATAMAAAAGGDGGGGGGGDGSGGGGGGGGGNGGGGSGGRGRKKRPPLAGREPREICIQSISVGGCTGSFSPRGEAARECRFYHPPGGAVTTANTTPEQREALLKGVANFQGLNRVLDPKLCKGVLSWNDLSAPFQHSAVRAGNARNWFDPPADPRSTKPLTAKQAKRLAAADSEGGGRGGGRGRERSNARAKSARRIQHRRLGRHHDQHPHHRHQQRQWRSQDPRLGHDGGRRRGEHDVPRRIGVPRGEPPGRDRRGGATTGLH